MLVPARGVWVFLSGGRALDGLESLDIGLGWSVSDGLLVAEAKVLQHSRVKNCVARSEVRQALWIDSYAGS